MFITCKSRLVAMRKWAMGKPSPLFDLVGPSSSKKNRLERVLGGRKKGRWSGEREKRRREVTLCAP